MATGLATDELELLLSESPAAALRRERDAFDDLAAPFEKRLVLFGAGGFGRRTLAGLRTLGIEPLAFADNDPALWGRSVEGLRVVSPEEAARVFADDAAFVLTIWNGRATDRMADRVRQLQNLGCTRVIPAGFLFWKYPETFLPYYPLDLPHKLLMKADEVKSAFELWTDEASRREYVAQILFRLHLDYDGVGRPGLEPHYFPDLFQVLPDEVLIDCGAFDGDTIRGFVARQGDRFSQILAFEPDPLTWPRLQETVAALPAEIQRKIACFPQAVSAVTGTIRFDSTGTDLSVSGSGAMSVQCVELDEVLRACATAPIKPTMIKFDIEGAELDALSGGRRTIRKNLPVLAVSTYHQQSHLWEIPLAIAGIASEYRFGLRPHAAEGWDLVCYAIPPERWAL
jgi:FkbM family methyltransferase